MRWVNLLSTRTINGNGKSGKPVNSVVLWQMPVMQHAAGLWAQILLVYAGPPRPPSWNLLLTVCTETYTQVACWRSFSGALAVLLLFLFAQRSELSCYWAFALLPPPPLEHSQCTGVLLPLPHGNVGTAVLLALLVESTTWATPTDASHTSSLTEVVMIIGSPFHLLSITFAQRHIILIHNHYCFLTRKVHMPDMWFTLWQLRPPYFYFIWLILYLKVTINEARICGS